MLNYNRLRETILASTVLDAGCQRRSCVLSKEVKE